MQRLILLRHGEAEAQSASGRDLDRALTAAGITAVARTAKALALAMAIPDIALVSTAKRTRQTWAEAKAQFSLSDELFKTEIYNAGPPTLLALARDSQADTVMIVGHNPSLQGLALDLLSRQGAAASLVARVEARFPPATAAVFSFHDGRPELDALLMGGLV
jgi:phosphohistidine phosphatase